MGGVDVWTFSDLKQLQVNFTLHAILKGSRAELIFAGMEMQWHEGGGRILLGDNTGRAVVTT